MAKTIARARDVAKVRNVNRDIKKNVRELRPGGRWLPYAIPRDASPGVLRRNQSGHEGQQHAHTVSVAVLHQLWGNCYRKTCKSARGAFGGARGKPGDKPPPPDRASPRLSGIDLGRKRWRWKGKAAEGTAQLRPGAATWRGRRYRFWRDRSSRAGAVT